MIRTFVPSLMIVILLAGFVSPRVPQNAQTKKNAQTDAGLALQVLYRPDRDKVQVIHPIYRPGIDKFEIKHPVYRPGIDKFEVRNLSYPASPTIAKQTTITLTSNINEKTLSLRDSATVKVPAVKTERGSSRCAEKAKRSLL